ncbi:MAG TPA: alpha-E domain-containing protein [Candidatus Binatia bacterium]|nr:alpha-E domain-containing protein [Candidatus Binatia bacterium]
MLSRVADALYWMGRYLERAENLTRLLLVTEDSSTEVLGLDEELALAEWHDLLRIFPGPEIRRDPDRPPPFFAFAYLDGLSFDPRHPYSIQFSLKKARENARAVREALTVEVFVSLNDTWRDLEVYTRRGSLDAPMFRDALSQIHRGILSTVGAIEHTLTRDQGWLFLKMGESLERVLRTATVLRAKLPALLAPQPAIDVPLFYSRWRALLRGLSSLENYRHACGARMEPADVLSFLLFDPHAPRSVHYGTAAVKGYLDRLAEGDGRTSAGRIIGRLHADLAYRDETAARRGDDGPFLDHVVAELARTHDALSAHFFEG